jgi:hypothetical protein
MVNRLRYSFFQNCPPLPISVVSWC